MATGAVNALFGYGYWTLAARSMPTEAVGLGSAATSAMVLLSLLVHLGPGAGLIARLPGRTTPAQWRVTAVSTLVLTATATLTVAAVAVLPLGFAVTALRPLTRDPAFALCFILGATFWTCAGICDYVFIAERRSDLMLVRNATTAATKLTLLVVLWRTVPSIGALGLVATWAVGGLLGFAMGLWLCNRRVNRLGRVHLISMAQEATHLIRPALGHHGISVGGLAPTLLLPLVVTARLGAHTNAHFYVTWMVGSSIFMISPAVSAALFAHGSHHRDGLRRVALRSLGTTLAAITVPAVVLGLIGRPVLELFGAGYSSGYVLLLLLIASAFPDTVSNVAVATLRVRGLLTRAVCLNAVIGVAAVAGTWLLTPDLGIDGAGLAWLGAQTIGALAVLALPKALLPPPDSHRPVSHRKEHRPPAP
ncbi:lipopolysaccharide biosynthesis protein [Streptacidiphilus sp. MAP12-20]|uniref:lipopolysaccharide biosynthesis protein n=1 Tax=Streptacidiphilus sp. MAP12-20 TaxID=3156299 RepID=UPI0035145D73